jgi:hypothetical protein
VLALPSFGVDPMNFKKFQELKRRLVEGTNFSETWEFYMDHFTDSPKFIEMGQPVHCEELNEIVRATCQEMFNKSAKVDTSIVIHIPESKFFHGPIQVGKRMGGMMFFEDIEMGMIAVSAEYPPTPETKYSRFTIKLRMSSRDPNELN